MHEGLAGEAGRRLRSDEMALFGFWFVGEEKSQEQSVSLKDLVESLK
jgi:hypothetical protein